MNCLETAFHQGCEEELAEQGQPDILVGTGVHVLAREAADSPAFAWFNQVAFGVHEAVFAAIEDDGALPVAGCTHHHPKDTRKNKCMLTNCSWLSRQWSN